MRAPCTIRGSLTRNLGLVSRDSRVVLGVVLCAVAFAAATPVSAQSATDAGAEPATETDAETEPRHLGYVEYSAGVSIVPNQNVTGQGLGGSGLSGSAQLDAGYSVGAAVGREFYERWGASLRGELALNFRSNDATSLSLAGEPANANGQLYLFTAMLNGFVDYDLRLPVVPFVGFGVGYGLIDMDIENGSGPTKINDSDSVFAWNVMVGGTLAFTTTTDFTMSYRYLMTTDPEFGGRFQSSSRDFDSEYDLHEVVLGMRVNF